MTTTADSRALYLKPAEIAERFGFTVEHLAQLRYTGNGPKFLKPTPRTVLYREQDVIDWIEASEQTITSRA